MPFNSNFGNKELTITSFKIQPNTFSQTQNQIQPTKKKEQDSDVNIRIGSPESSNCFRSTHYSMNSTGNKFFNSQNLSNSTNFNTQNLNNNNNLFNSVNLNSNNICEEADSVHPLREIKSSYSTFRPKYDYKNLLIEKNILTAKQKELAEKRNEEEMKEFINEWGISRARYIEEVEKKNETKKLLKLYEKNMSNINNLKIIKSDSVYNSVVNNKLVNDYSSPIKNRISPPDYIRSDSFEKENIENNLKIANELFLQSSEKLKNDNIININEKPSKEDIPLIPINTNINNVINTINTNQSEAKEKNITPEKEKKEKILKERIRRQNTQNVKNIVSRNTKKNIKNLDQNSNKITINKDIKIIKINFKEPVVTDKVKTIIQNMKSNLEKIPTDNVILMKANDKIFDARHTYGTLLNVKEIDNYNDNYKYIMNPLSLYDKVNVQNLKINKGINENIIIDKGDRRPSTGFEFLKSRYNNNPDFSNLLTQRKNLTKFNSENTFRDSSEKVRNITINLDRVKSAFNPPIDEKVYPKFYLPEPGRGLLGRIVIPKKKGKKKGKSTKKTKR